MRKIMYISNGNRIRKDAISWALNFHSIIKFVEYVRIRYLIYTIRVGVRVCILVTNIDIPPLAGIISD